MRKLEIGPAIDGTLGPDWEGLDVVARAQHVCCWGSEPLQFADGTFSRIYASHVLEHVPWFRTVDALQEARRILTAGGTLEVWVPDFEKVLAVYRSGTLPEDWTPFNEDRDPMLWVAGRLFCGTRLDEESSWHRAVFDERHLGNCLRRAGFGNIHRLAQPPAEQHVNHATINLGMAADKP